MCNGRFGGVDRCIGCVKLQFGVGGACAGVARFVLRLLYCKDKAVQACEFALRVKELAVCVGRLLFGFRYFALLCFRVGFCLLECFGGICGCLLYTSRCV